MLTMVGWDVTLITRPAFPQMSFARITTEISHAVYDYWDDCRGFRVKVRMLMKAILGCRLIHVHASYIHENYFKTSIF